MAMFVGSVKRGYQEIGTPVGSISVYRDISG